MTQAVSLHIGVNEVDPNHYAGWSGPLQACEADADDYLALAVDRGFEARALLTDAAVRTTVVEGIRDAASRLEEGDMFLLTYSGHGGQIPDSSGDEIDGFDETWCLFDGQLVDDELGALWAAFEPGVRILVISDSCHSGTAVRAPQLVDRRTLTSGPIAEDLGIVDAAYRAMPRRESLRTFRRNREFYTELQARLPEPTDPVATVRLLSGCQDNQLSLDGSRNGLFTATLLVVWDDGHFRGTYVDFHQQILELMPPNQSPNHMVIGTPSPSYDHEQPFTP